MNFLSLKALTRAGLGLMFAVSLPLQSFAQDGREEVYSLWIDQFFVPPFSPLIDLNHLVSQQYPGENLANVGIKSIQANVDGQGQLDLMANGSHLASGGVNGPGFLEIYNPNQAIKSNSWSVFVNGGVHVESIDVIIIRDNVVVPPVFPPVIPPVFPPVGPSLQHIEYQQHVPQGHSAFFGINPGKIRKIKVLWTDFTEGAKADFKINGQLVAQGVDVNSGSDGRTVDVNYEAHGPSTLEIIIREDPAFINYVEITYANDFPGPAGDQHFDYNQRIERDHSASFTLNGGYLGRLRFSWTDFSDGADAYIYINGEKIGSMDVKSNKDIHDFHVNRQIPPNSNLTIVITDDPAHIYWIEADFG